MSPIPAQPSPDPPLNNYKPAPAVAVAHGAPGALYAPLRAPVLGMRCHSAATELPRRPSAPLQGPPALDGPSKRRLARCDAGQAGSDARGRSSSERERQIPAVVPAPRTHGRRDFKTPTKSGGSRFASGGVLERHAYGNPWGFYIFAAKPRCGPPSSRILGLERFPFDHRSRPWSMKT